MTDYYQARCPGCKYVFYEVKREEWKKYSEDEQGAIGIVSKQIREQHYADPHHSLCQVFAGKNFYESLFITK